MDDIVKKTSVSRRGFVRGLGLSGGLILAAPLVAKSGKLSDTFLAQAAETSATDVLDPSVYVQVDGEGTVHIFIHRVEMGQGSRTGLPQIIADELDADWSRINFIQGNGDPKYGDQNTDGSTSIRMFFDAFRTAGATARTMLEQAAAAEWGLNPDQVAAENHQIKSLIDDRAEDLGHFVAAAAKLAVPAPESLTFKAADKRRYVGKPVKIIDMDGIITGTANFGQDAMMDDMLFAVVARPPVVGGAVKNYDKAAAMAVNGVVGVIELPALSKPVVFKPLGGVAVLATNTWAAMKGREALNATFEDGESAGHNSTAFEKDLWASIEKGGRVALKRGEGAEGLASAAKLYEADYFVPYLVHAPMEPPAALASFADDGTLDIYTHGQDPTTVQATVAPYVGIEAPFPEKIRVHSQLLGGAFGRKSKPDFAAEAAILAKATGKPVKVVWSREDDVRHSFYHAISAQRIQVGLSAEGKVESWSHKAAYPTIFNTFNPQATAPVDFELGLGLTDMPWQIDNMQVESCDAKNHVRVGWLRSVTNIQQAFAIGSMVDEIAMGEGNDTYSQWMDMIGDDRHINPADDGATYPNYNDKLEKFPIDTARLKAALTKVKDMSGYGRKMPEGKSMGIAVHRSFVSYVACAVEMSDRDGVPHVDKAWMVVDCGLAVNPDRVKAQMEGAVVFGISIAMHGKITAENGRIVESNYDGYPVARIDEVPETEVHIMDVDAPPGGVGEPGVPPVVAAIAQAASRLTGTRIRRLPIMDQI